MPAVRLDSDFCPFVQRWEHLPLAICMIASSPEFHIKIWNLLKEIFHHSAKEVQTYLSIITSYLNKGCQRAFFSVVSKYYDREKKKKKEKKSLDLLFFRWWSYIHSKMCYRKLTVSDCDACEGDDLLLWRCTDHPNQRKERAE